MAWKSTATTACGRGRAAQPSLHGRRLDAGRITGTSSGPDNRCSVAEPAGTGSSRRPSGRGSSRPAVRDRPAGRPRPAARALESPPDRRPGPGRGPVGRSYRRLRSGSGTRSRRRHGRCTARRPGSRWRPATSLGKSPPSSSHDDPGGPLEVDRPPVVAQAAPRPKDVGGARAASDSTVGNWAVNLTQAGPPREIWVCCRSVSETRTRYGSVVPRNGKARPWASNQARTALRNAARSSPARRSVARASPAVIVPVSRIYRRGDPPVRWPASAVARRRGCPPARDVLRRSWLRICRIINGRSGTEELAAFQPWIHRLQPIRPRNPRSERSPRAGPATESGRDSSVALRGFIFRKFGPKLGTGPRPARVPTA